MFYTAQVPSPVGTITLACDGTGKSLTGLWIEGQKYHGGAILESAVPCGDMPVFCDVRRWLSRYFAGRQPAASEIPCDPPGGSFRREVFRILCKIPYGEVLTYGEIAKQIARNRSLESMSSRAVGGAVGHNPISILIPCHRVVGAGGRLTGYAAGLPTKKKLLALEGVGLSALPGRQKRHLEEITDGSGEDGEKYPKNG